MDNPDDGDTPTVILTPAQRRFIDEMARGELGDMSDAAIRQTRYRIRERVKIALDDMELLSHLHRDDLELIGDGYGERWAGWTWGGEDILPYMVSDILNFFVQLFGEDVFTTAVEDTVRKYREEQLRRRQKVADVTVNTDVLVEDVRTADGLKQRYEAGEDLTDSELFLLASTRRIPAEVYNEQIESTTLRIEDD